MQKKKFTFRTKLLIAFSFTALVTAFVGTVGYACFHRIHTTLDHATKVDLPALVNLGDADMYHDGLRAVVMTALVEAEKQNPKGEQAVRTELAEFSEGLSAALTALDKLPLDPAQQASVRAVRTDLDQYVATSNRLVDLAFKDRPAAIARTGEFQEGFERLEESLGKLGNQLEEQTSGDARRGSAAGTTGSRILIFAVIGGSLLTIGLGVAFSRTLLAALLPMVQALERNAEETSISAAELASASQSLAEGASRNAAALEESGAALEEMSSMTKRNANSTRTGKEISAQAREAAGEGLGRMDEMGLTISGIKTAVTEMQTAVTEMQASGEEVSKIIKTIDEIAFQTNLLALNAAIEAARAGEAGMGFAVVADEVRVLAQRSAQAAKDTAEKIQTSLKRSEQGAHASAAVVKNLAGVEMTAAKVQQGFEAIVTKITSLDEVIAEVAAASQEQSHGIAEVARAVGEMDKLSQASAANAEENAGSAHELTSRSNSLREVVQGLQELVGANSHTSSAIVPAVSTVSGANPQTASPAMIWPTPRAPRESASHFLS